MSWHHNNADNASGTGNLLSNYASSGGQSWFQSVGTQPFSRSNRTIDTSGASGLVPTSSMNVGDGIQKDNTFGLSKLMERLGDNDKVKVKRNIVEFRRQQCNDYFRGPQWQSNPGGFPEQAFRLTEDLTRARFTLHWTVLTETDPDEIFETIKQIKSACLCSQQRIPVVRAIVEGKNQHHACFCGKHKLPVQQELDEANWMTVLDNICNTFENHCTAILTNAIADATAAQADDSFSANADRYSIAEPHQQLSGYDGNSRSHTNSGGVSSWQDSLNYNQFLSPNQSSFRSFPSIPSPSGHQSESDMLHSTVQLVERLLESLPNKAKALSLKIESNPQSFDPQSSIIFPLRTYKNTLEKAKRDWSGTEPFSLEYQLSRAYGFLRTILKAAFDVEAARLGNRSDSSTMRQACSCVKQAIIAICRNTSCRDGSHHCFVHSCSCDPLKPHHVERRVYSADEGSKAIEEYIGMFQRLWKSEDLEGESIFDPPT